jgi:ribosome-associated translation inhibitor RaiA
MQIEVSGSPAVDVARLRAYAEYRVFTRLVAFAPHLETVRVVVSRSTDHRPTSCVMTAELRQGGRIQTRSRSRQPTRAVDSAAERLAEAAGERLQSL